MLSYVVAHLENEILKFCCIVSYCREKDVDISFAQDAIDEYKVWFHMNILLRISFLKIF